MTLPGAPAPIGGKKSTWKDESVKDNWMYKNRRLHTYLSFPMSLPDDLAWLESAEGAPASMGGGKNSKWTDESVTVIWTGLKRWNYMFTYLISTPNVAFKCPSPARVLRGTSTNRWKKAKWKDEPVKVIWAILYRQNHTFTYLQSIPQLHSKLPCPVGECWR